MNKQYYSLNKDLKRIRMFEAMKQSQLNQLISSVGNEIQANIDDPYGYLVRKNFSVDQDHNHKSETQKYRRAIGSMSIAEIWTKKMKKKCDEILIEMKKKQEKELLELSKLQSQETNLFDDSLQITNANKLIEKLGLRSFKQKKQKGQLAKLASILSQPINPSPYQFSPDNHKTRSLSKLFDFQNYHNSQSTTSSTKNLVKGNFRKYSVNHEIEGSLKKCIGDCDSLMNKYKDVEKKLKEPTKSRLDLYIEKQRKSLLLDLIDYERQRKNK